MAWNGSGTFTRTNGTNTGSTTWTKDKNAGTKVTSVLHDTHDQDLATGINNCLAKDGQNAMTGDLPMGGNDLTNVGQITQIAGSFDWGSQDFTAVGDIGCGAISASDTIYTSGSIETDTNVSIGTTLSVTGASTLSSLSVTSITSDTSFTGSPTFSANTTFSDILTCSGTLKISSSAPTTAGDPGAAGTVTYDSDYIYICIASDTWKRVAIATW